MGVCQEGDLTAEGGKRRFGCRGWVPVCTGTTSGSRGWVPVCTGTTVGFPGFPRRAGEGGFQTRPYGRGTAGGHMGPPLREPVEGGSHPHPRIEYGAGSALSRRGRGGRGDPAPGPRSSGTAGGHVGPPLRSAVGGAPSPPYRVRGRLPAVLRWRLTLA